MCGTPAGGQGLLTTERHGAIRDGSARTAAGATTVEAGAHANGTATTTDTAMGTHMVTTNSVLLQSCHAVVATYSAT